MTAPGGSPTPEPTDLDKLLVKLRRHLATLMGTGETWKVILHGGPHDIRVEVHSSETVSFRRTHGPVVRRVAD